jgi:hypothetical protein
VHFVGSILVSICGFTSCTFAAKLKETVKTFRIVQNYAGNNGFAFHTCEVGPDCVHTLYL